MSYIDELRETIHKVHGATATHVESVPVIETLNGQTIWDGIVEVFDIHGHPGTHRVYAWSQETDDSDDPKRYVTVLHLPPVVSPIRAVRAAIVQEYRANAKA